MRQRVFAFAFIFLTAVAPSAHAQKCKLSDKLVTCWNSVVGGTAAAKKVATANTGVPGITQPNASSVRDFLNLFAAAVETATVSEGNNALTLDWNVPFDYMATDDKIKVQAIFTKPALSTQVKTALGTNSAAITELTDSLDDSDDIKASVSYSPISPRLGRSLAPHDLLLQGLLRAASPDEVVALQNFAKLMGSLQGIKTKTGGLPNQDTTFEELPNNFGPDFMARLEASARAEKAIAEQVQTAVDAFATVLNNQPQAYGTVVYHSRNDIAGPTDWSGKFTFEMGRRNLNRFLHDHRDDCEINKIGAEARGETDVDESARCLQDLLSYAKKAGMDAGGASRLAISVEYQQTQHTTITLPSKYSIAPVNSPGSHSLVYSVTWGLPMATPLEAREGRLEVALNYENVSTDPNKKDRFVGSVTYTQKLSDAITVPISLVYANHKQYLPQSDRQLGVHFGLSYKLPDLTP